MNDVDRWFERTAGKEDRAVSLYTSFLTGRVFAYFRYRLSYTLMLEAARAVIHVAEFLIVLINFGGMAAFTVMVLRVGSLIIGGAWWGLLEVMRERLRMLARFGERRAAEREIGRWLVLSMVAAVALLFAGGVALALLFPPDDDPIAHVYAYLILGEFALRLPVRVLQSGMVATRRVYRPLWAMFAPTGVQILVLSVGVLVYPAAAVVLAIIASNAIGIWITVRYTLRAYRLAGLSPTHRAAATSSRRLLPVIPPQRGVEATLAGLSLRLDAMVVLAIVGIYGTNTRAFDLTAGFSAWRDIDAFQFFYLILPLFRGAYEATGVFYFDFVRLWRIPALRQFRLAFFHRLLWTTPFLALYFWALAAVLGVVILPDIPFSFLLALLPLFLIRSVIGTYQIRMFAEGHFRTLIATVVLLIALLWLVWIDVNPASDLVQIMAALVVLLVVHINLAHFQDRVTPLPTLLSLGDWIHALAEEQGPVRVSRVALPHWVPKGQKSAAVKLMQETFDGKGHFAFRTPTALFFYERTSNGEALRPSHLTLQSITGGAMNRGECRDATNGRHALGQLLDANWILPSDEASAAPEWLTGLRAGFLEVFPDGMVLDLDTREGTRDIRKLKQGLLTGMLPTAMRSLEEGSAVARVSGRCFSPVFRQGKLRLLLILPPEFEAEQFRRWLRILKGRHDGGRTMESVSHVRED